MGNEPCCHVCYVSYVSVFTSLFKCENIAALRAGFSGSGEKQIKNAFAFSLLTNTFLVAFGTQGLGAWYDDPTDESVPARACI